METNKIFIALAILCIILVILFYISLQTTMDLVSSKNRQMPGAYVWLNFIPIFGIFWPFIFNASLAKSIENELKDKGSEEKVNLYSGTIVYPISILFLTNLSYSSYTTFSNSIDYGILYLFGLFLFSTFYFWIVFWEQVIRFKKILQGQVASAPESVYFPVYLFVFIFCAFIYFYFENYLVP